MRARIDEDKLPILPPVVPVSVTDTLTPQNLDDEHLRSYMTAITRILNADVAEVAFSEIIDGYPTLNSFLEFTWRPLDDKFPLQHHTELCEGSVEKFRPAIVIRPSFLSIRTTGKWHPGILLIDRPEVDHTFKALQGFQDASPGTRVFSLRLLELVAVACHQMAALLLQTEGNKHKEEYDAWVAETQRLKDAGEDRCPWYKSTPPVAFHHKWYVDHEQYPRGVRDMVGYWAEAKILGGVLLCERGESGTECNEVYFHASLKGRGPETIFPPTPDQLKDMTAFLNPEPGTDPISCPFPIRATKHNRPRYDRYHGTKYFNIYRNWYDHRVPSYFLRRDTCSSNDYPEIEDELWLHEHTHQVAAGLVEWDAARVAEAKDNLKKITPSSPLWYDVEKKYI